MPDGDWIRLIRDELKEHLDPLCTAKMERLYDRICHERELREADETKRAHALKVQATEYERRLDGLNGEAERLKQAHAESRDELKQIQSRYLLESRFDQYLADRKQWEAQRQFWEQSVSKQLDGYRGALAAWGAVVVVIGLLLKFVPIGP